MLKMQGSIKGLKIVVNATGMSRQVTFDVAGDSVLDELQEIMMRRSRLNISLETQQMELGDAETDDDKFQGRTKVPA